MTDEEMKAMPLAELQDDGGLLFLWVTGRAVSLWHRAQTRLGAIVRLMLFGRHRPSLAESA